jgi:hypothetical protein
MHDVCVPAWAAAAAAGVLAVAVLLAALYRGAAVALEEHLRHARASNQTLRHQCLWLRRLLLRRDELLREAREAADRRHHDGV